MDADIKRNTNVIKGLEEQIRVETAKLETDKQAEREEREREMDGIRRGIEELEAESLNIDGRIHSAKEMLEQADRVLFPQGKGGQAENDSSLTPFSGLHDVAFVVRTSLKPSVAKRVELEEFIGSLMSRTAAHGKLRVKFETC